MLHHSGKRDREGPGEIAHRGAALHLELRQKRSPGGIGESGEGAIEDLILILNH